MSYVLQALVARLGTLKAFPLQTFDLVELNNAVEMLPLTEALRGKIGLPFLQLCDEGGGKLPIAAYDIFSRASGAGKLAYIEAEFFGGVGTQASLLFQEGASVSEIKVGPGAINDALRFIGVVANPGFDEFDTVGLGKHRDTEKWILRP